ncbi:hypothetical protein GCM10027515_33280 [Schumannella luteola]|uniref:Uncharacterized protein n=1 Tax=Schumannella luteola TaxID=472059 RepID=A0A852Y8Y0_9MICO|nr:hypothetical protein [Schumannella luteola]NYG98873.1 hypothetical protein [Schumannella luteola]TPX01952.1 hypothetical protein FJ656_24915 [Schumannella luteola]
MAEVRHGLRREIVDEDARDRLLAAHTRLGLDGLLGAARRATGWAARLGLRRDPAVPRTRRMTRIRSTAPAATHTLRWHRLDDWSQRWWPQGIEVIRRDGRRVLLVSWYAQKRRGASQGSRLSIVDLDVRRPRYWNVLLVNAVTDDAASGGVRFEPVEVHAGGIAVTGDRLLVAAASGGLREFRLGDLLLLGGSGRARAGIPWAAGRLPFGHRIVLPQHRAYSSLGARGRLRFSFISLESGKAGGTADVGTGTGTGTAGAYLVAGEFSSTPAGGRLLRIPLDADALLDGCGADDEPDRIPIDDVHQPGLRGLQGAVVVDGTWFLTSTNGDRRDGDLWVGGVGDSAIGTGAPPASAAAAPSVAHDDRAAELEIVGGFVRHREVLPSGPEDIAVDPDRRRLWTHSEWPGRRRVVALDLRRWTRS